MLKRLRSWLLNQEILIYASVKNLFTETFDWKPYWDRVDIFVSHLPRGTYVAKTSSEKLRMELVS